MRKILVTVVICCTLFLYHCQDKGTQVATEQMDQSFFHSGLISSYKYFYVNNFFDNPAGPKNQTEFIMKECGNFDLGCCDGSIIYYTKKEDLGEDVFLYEVTKPDGNGGSVVFFIKVFFDRETGRLLQTTKKVNVDDVQSLIPRSVLAITEHALAEEPSLNHPWSSRDFSYRDDSNNPDFPHGPTTGVGFCISTIGTFMLSLSDNTVATFVSLSVSADCLRSVFEVIISSDGTGVGDSRQYVLMELKTDGELLRTKMHAKLADALNDQPVKIFANVSAIRDEHPWSHQCSWFLYKSDSYWEPAQGCQFSIDAIGNFSIVVNCRRTDQFFCVQKSGTGYIYRVFLPNAGPMERTGSATSGVLGPTGMPLGDTYYIKIEKDSTTGELKRTPFCQAMNQVSSKGVAIPFASVTFPIVRDHSLTQHRLYYAEMGLNLFTDAVIGSTITVDQNGGFVVGSTLFTYMRDIRVYDTQSAHDVVVFLYSVLKTGSPIQYVLIKLDQQSLKRSIYLDRSTDFENPTIFPQGVPQLTYVLASTVYPTHHRMYREKMNLIYNPPNIPVPMMLGMIEFDGMGSFTIPLATNPQVLCRFDRISPSIAQPGARLTDLYQVTVPTPQSTLPEFYAIGIRKNQNGTIDATVLEALNRPVRTLAQACQAVLMHPPIHPFAEAANTALLLEGRWIWKSGMLGWLMGYHTLTVNSLGNMVSNTPYLSGAKIFEFMSKNLTHRTYLYSYHPVEKGMQKASTMYVVFYISPQGVLHRSEECVRKADADLFLNNTAPNIQWKLVGSKG